MTHCGIITYQQETKCITAPLQHRVCESHFITQTSRQVSFMCGE